MKYSVHGRIYVVSFWNFSRMQRKLHNKILNFRFKNILLFIRFLVLCRKTLDGTFEFPSCDIYILLPQKRCWIRKPNRKFSPFGDHYIFRTVIKSLSCKSWKSEMRNKTIELWQRKKNLPTGENLFTLSLCLPTVEIADQPQFMGGSVKGRVPSLITQDSGQGEATGKKDHWSMSLDLLLFL